VAETFFEHPILNSPYVVPTRHHDLDEEGQPTDAPLIQRGRPVGSMDIRPAGAARHIYGMGAR